MRRRLSLAWHVLCGRPLAYRLNFEGGTMHPRPWTKIIECTFWKWPS